jgi:SAM-dependent methyltransferase
MNTPQLEHPQQQPAPPADAFRFGRNWQRYIADYLDPDRERIAAESLRELVGDLTGKTFLDIGCGSGLFSRCAYRAGAAHIVSLDVDPDAVAATEQLRSHARKPDNWRVIHASILDPDLVRPLDCADIVYSWGVLHHTGDMYAAIRNAAALVKPGGLFAIAIYNHVTGRWLDSRRWWTIKRSYNRAPRFVQVLMEWTYAAYWCASCVRGRRSPLRVAREYRHSRGMALSTDLVDWLGGYPYEFATAEEILDFCERACGLNCVKLMSVTPADTGNNQFVFERPSA